ncbi:hypothetical protein BJY00DRAFT_277881, partial [Aspergillus carlsbadensis]
MAMIVLIWTTYLTTTRAMTPALTLRTLEVQTPPRRETSLLDMEVSVATTRSRQPATRVSPMLPSRRPALAWTSPL